MNKFKHIIDKGTPRDRCSCKDTRIKIYVPGTNILLFEGIEEKNKIIASGAELTAKKHFKLENQIITPTYNLVLNLDHTTLDEVDHTAEEFVYLFAIGTDGCGNEQNQVYTVDYAKWIAAENLVPFRYVPDTQDIVGAARNKYFGRKDTQAGYVAYYFKAPDLAPKFIRQYVDGTPIDSNLFDSTKTDEVEIFVQSQLSVTPDECREFFQATVGITSAKVSSLSLLTAYPTVVNGITYYQNIRPLSKYHFPSESLMDLSKGMDIVYDVFY